ncbi:MAG: TonB-dependent receptor [Terracidiphilus sp.]
MFKHGMILFFMISIPAFCQSNSGEMRLKVIDPSGRGVKTTVQIISRANGYRNVLATNDQGDLDVQRLPFGIYQLRFEQPGFAARSESVEIRSTLSKSVKIELQLATVNQSVTVSGADPLIDPDQPGSVSQIGTDLIQDRIGSVPGRDLQDLVNSQPGWLYEGNAVLHPRGSEYQTQFVVDGIPLTDNRSPSFGPEIEADDVESMTIFTAGIPAEYGRKMGGVVELNTLQDAQAGFHGQVVLSGGSFDSSGGFAKGQYVWGKNTIGGSASGSTTAHYLNPVVPQNFSNTGTLGDFSLDYARDLTADDRVKFTIRHELARYDIPNEMVQQAVGQRQNADNFETMGTASWDHTFSPSTTGDLRGMVRDNANDFYSNPQSTPIIVSQHNWFREGYFKASVTTDRGRNEWKAGVESDNVFLNEMLNYIITDPTQFDPGSPTTFAYQANRPDLEQSGFVQDLIRLHNWTISAGLRWDHYQLLLNQQALQPRFAVSHYFQSHDAVIHFSYDRIFQTPSFENILLSSSPSVASIDPTGFLNLPVRPSKGDYYEAGLTKAFMGRLRLGSNYFRRVVDNFADDSQIFNTTISFPISFRKAILYGIEGKIDVPEWHRISGFGSYSYIVGNAWFPVTGGLFFGSDASQAASQLTGHSPDSQDQRNTVRGRVRYQLTRRVWTAFGAQFDSGLPFDFDGDPATVLAEYGQQVLNRINFDRGRIYPAFQANASAGAEIYSSDRVKVRFEADGQNLNNILNVIDFGGLFSGNAIGPSRSFSLRLATEF